jgi:hypothetical protein
MPGSLSSLKESLLGKEINKLICLLPRRRAIEVFYTYYESKPRSHRLEFRRGKRVKFWIFLPRYGENLSQFCSVIESIGYQRPGGEKLFAIWARLALRLTAGSLISCQDLFAGPNSEIRTQYADAGSDFRYRLAYCKKGAQDSIILVSSRHGRQSSTFRKGKHLEFNWFRLSLGEARILVEQLRAFISSQEFSEINTGIEKKN